MSYRMLKIIYDHSVAREIAALDRVTKVSQLLPGERVSAKQRGNRRVAQMMQFLSLKAQEDTVVLPLFATGIALSFVPSGTRLSTVGAIYLNGYRITRRTVRIVLLAAMMVSMMLLLRRGLVLVLVVAQLAASVSRCSGAVLALSSAQDRSVLFRRRRGCGHGRHRGRTSGRGRRRRGR